MKYQNWNLRLFSKHSLHKSSSIFLFIVSAHFIAGAEWKTVFFFSYRCKFCCFSKSLNQCNYVSVNKAIALPSPSCSGRKFQKFPTFTSVRLFVIKYFFFKRAHKKCRVSLCNEKRAKNLIKTFPIHSVSSINKTFIDANEDKAFHCLTSRYWILNIFQPFYCHRHAHAVKL